MCYVCVDVLCLCVCYVCVKCVCYVCVICVSCVGVLYVCYVCVMCVLCVCVMCVCFCSSLLSSVSQTDMFSVDTYSEVVYELVSSKAP